MKKRIVAAVCAVIAVLMIAAAVYVNDFYHATEEALFCLEEPAEGVDVVRQGDILFFVPENAEAGVIFYPGGKVQAESYAPLM